MNILYHCPRSTTGFDHADIYPERYEPTEGNAMTEMTTFLLALLSIGIFLAHAIDAIRAP
jgi:hypothetical protein